MAYDGHIRCLDSLGLDVFTTFTVGAATEFPAEIILILVLDHLGRKWSLVGSVMLSGLASFGASSVPIGIYFASFATIGRLFINIATNVGLQYASELLPTVVRGEGVSFIHNMGFLTSILSPFIAYTSKIQYNMPMLILGSVSIFAGILCLFLPETLKEKLPQTILVRKSVVNYYNILKLTLHLIRKANYLVLTKNSGSIRVSRGRLK